MESIIAQSSTPGYMHREDMQGKRAAEVCDLLSAPSHNTPINTYEWEKIANRVITTSLDECDELLSFVQKVTGAIMITCPTPDLQLTTE
jgi:hypothetical protein